MFVPAALRISTLKATDETLAASRVHQEKRPNHNLSLDAIAAQMPVPATPILINGVMFNLKDQLQCINDVFQHLYKGKAVVDYFLSHIVFPKEMKEFPHKLSASGWDVGKKKTHT